MSMSHEKCRIAWGFPADAKSRLLLFSTTVHYATFAFKVLHCTSTADKLHAMERWFLFVLYVCEKAKGRKESKTKCKHSGDAIDSSKRAYSASRKRRDNMKTCFRAVQATKQRIQHTTQIDEVMLLDVTEQTQPFQKGSGGNSKTHKRTFQSWKASERLSSSQEK